MLDRRGNARLPALRRAGRQHQPPLGLAAGDYTFRVRATDPAGNRESSPASRRFTVLPKLVTASAAPTGALTVPVYVICPAEFSSGCTATVVISPAGAKGARDAAALVTFQLKLRAGQRVKPRLVLPASVRAGGPSGSGPPSR